MPKKPERTASFPQRRSFRASPHLSTCPQRGPKKPRILPTPENHEYKNPGAFGYYDYWGSQAGPDRRGYYAIRAPGWLILSCDSEIDAGPGSDRAAWLRDKMKTAKEACIFAFYRKPAHSLLARRRDGAAVALFADLHRAGASFVMNGDNHFYERTDPLDGDGKADRTRGAVGFTVGTGGKANAPIPALAETAAAVFESVGMFNPALRDRSYSWAWIDAVSREVLDSGTRDRNAGRSGLHPGLR